MKIVIDNSYNPVLSKLFSTALFKDFATGNSRRLPAIKQIYKAAFKENNSLSLKDFFTQTYNHLRKSYPSEYIYKNEIINQIVLRNHKINDACLFTEFPCIVSKADLLVVNGTTTIYEIKTELDTLNRLKDQVGNYQKAFSHVNIITCPSNVDKVIKLLNMDTVGIISFDAKKNVFDTVQTSREDISFLRSIDMFSILHLAEYKHIIEVEFGKVPAVINTEIFNKCFNLFRQLPIERQRDWVVTMLRERRLMEHQLKLFYSVPKSLNAISVTQKFSKNQCNNISHYLNNYL